MRQIDHIIAGDTPVSSRHSDIMDPNNGGVQGRVALAMRRCWKRQYKRRLRRNRLGLRPIHSVGRE